MQSGKIRLETAMAFADEMRGDEEYQRVRQCFHRLWTKYTGTPGYDKAEWRDLDNAIFAFAMKTRSHG